MPLLKKKYAPKRRLVRRKRLARPRRRVPSAGSFHIARKTALIQTYSNSAVSGTMVLNDPSGTCLSLGTPVAITGTTNCYDIPFAMKFRLDQLMNSTDITNISDQYKIKSVKVKVHINGVSNMYLNNAGSVQSWIEYIQDYDDATVPTLAQIREKMGVKTKYFTASRMSVSMGVRPRLADVVFGSGVSNAYAINKKSQFIDCNYPNAEHYGIKGVLHNVQLSGSTNVSSLFDWDVTQYVTAARLQ